jgi:hypothetical protein
LSAKDLQSKVAVQIGDTYELDDGNSVTFTGTLEFEPHFLLSINVEDWTLEELTARYTGRTDANISVSANTEIASLEKRWRVGNPIRFSTAVLWAGWVPVTITPQLQVWVGLDGSVGLTASTSVGMTVEASTGVEYTRANRWRWIRDFEKSFYWDQPSIEMYGSLTAWAGPHLEFMIYELAGPYLGVHGYGQFVVHTSHPPVELFVGLSFEAGFTTAEFLEMFGVSCDDCQVPLDLGVSYRVYPQENAIVRGVVVDEDGEPLSGVKVLVEAQEKTSTYTDHDGEYQLSVLSGAIPEIEFSKDGYQTSYRHDITVSPDQPTSLPAVSLFRIGIGSFGGIVTNAVNGQPVQGITLQARKGVDVTSGGIHGVDTTDASGGYQIEYVDAGAYTVEASGAGYETTFFTAECIANQSTDDQHGTVTPLLEGGDIRIVLTWGENPRDLDSHLTGPIQGSSSRFHVFYADKGNANSSPYAYLDRDDTQSYGPETTTITEVFDGLYRYSVHDYTNRHSTSSNALSLSSAHVDVYQGSNLWRTFDVPSQPGTLWTVFEYQNGQIETVNQMSYESSPSGVSKQLQTDAPLIVGLPDKEAE